MEERQKTAAYAGRGSLTGGGAQAEPKRSHKLTLHMRRSGILTGVKDVISFDEKEIVLETDLGMMWIVGTDLHVTRLSLETGEVDLEGTVDGIRYSDSANYHKPGESLWKRLLK